MKSKMSGISSNQEIVTDEIRNEVVWLHRCSSNYYSSAHYLISSHVYLLFSITQAYKKVAIIAMAGFSPLSLFLHLALFFVWFSLCTLSFSSLLLWRRKAFCINQIVPPLFSNNIWNRQPQYSKIKQVPWKAK